MRTLLLMLALLAPATADRQAVAHAREPGVERKLEIIEKNLAVLAERQAEVRRKLAAIGERLVALGRELAAIGSDDARRTAVVLEVGRLQADIRSLEERLRGLGRAMGPFRAEAERLRALL